MDYLVLLSLCKLRETPKLQRTLDETSLFQRLIIDRPRQQEERKQSSIRERKMQLSRYLHLQTHARVINMTPEEAITFYLRMKTIDLLETKGKKQ